MSVAPLASAIANAFANAWFDCSDPSTPTTIRLYMPVISLLV